MATLVKVKSSFGHDCFVSVERVDVIVFRSNGEAVIHVGPTEIVVSHEQARKLQKSIDPLA